MDAKQLKDTLLIKQTTFDMKANLKEKEPNFEARWIENKIYDKKLELNNKKPSFILHDGPPYANGNIHVGHALNKTLKDFIVRWKNSSGYQSPYIMGWDTHGLPIETAIAKTGVDRKTLAPSEFRDLCKNYALEQVANQKEQFKRLGIFTDYDKNYITLTHDFEMSQLSLYLKMIEKDLVYRALKPIYWSPSSESALAEAEIEYAEVKSPTIFVACPIVGDENTCVVIWTTTPWTIPSNQLIAMGQDLEYVIVKPSNDERQFVIAKDLVESVATQIGWEEFSIVKTISSSEMVGKEYVHPWYEGKTGEIVIGHHVTAEAGTGLVHIAGGFGEDDFLIVKNHGLEPFAPIDDQGKFDVRAKDSRLEGMFYEDANKVIGQDLEARNILLKLKFVKHQYPHDWRTKKPVIYRATSQWFVSVEKVKAEIDNVIINNVTTKPEWSKERLRNIIKDRNDWTISRQRLWGVPIIAFYDKDKNPHFELDVLKHAYNVIKEKGTNAWFELDADSFLPDAYKGKGWTKEKDILDVWFDSGSSNIALEQSFGFDRPYDVYLEGNDQYRGWFNSSMINSVIYDGKPAYKQLITHGMTNDEKGRKMSKSIGNTIDPLKIADELGSDILRLWVASTDYTDDQRIGNDILKQVSESYRKIRNTMRFMLSNLVDFSESKNYQTNLEEVDEYALHKLSVIKQKVSEAYDSYSFNNVFKLVNNFVINDLSAFYLDFIKDILYIEAENDIRRRQVQTVMFEQLWALIDMLRPIMPHTIEEIFDHMTGIEKVESVHLLDLREQKFLKDDEFVSNWDNIITLRDDVNGALEVAKNDKLIKKGFEAIVNICLNDNLEYVKNINDLQQIFIVNSVNFVAEKQSFEGKKSTVSIELKVGLKCERCWAIFDNLIEGVICERCHKVIS